MEKAHLGNFLAMRTLRFALTVAYGDDSHDGLAVGNVQHTVQVVGITKTHNQRVDAQLGGFQQKSGFEPKGGGREDKEERDS